MLFFRFLNIVFTEYEDWEIETAFRLFENRNTIGIIIIGLIFICFILFVYIYLQKDKISSLENENKVFKDQQSK